ncbi:DUF6049 family protein [Actinophytocola sp.]|uniref:DUF6049 family protein n=1 Tax=Actinophytocola sp. TaxID=1872138 RepID=UPI003D6B83A0
MTRWKAGAGFLMTALLALGPLATPAVAGSIGDLQPTGGTPTLRLEVDSLTPRVVTTATPRLTVAGRITNTGDRLVDEVRVKVQRGEPVETEAQLRELGELDTDSASSEFVDVADSLERGETARFEVVVRVRGAEQSLALSEPGVYPTLVNVNGRPDFGGQARLAAVSIPLPVLSAPGGKVARPKPTPPGLSFVWPILDTQPRRLSTTDGQIVLTDDDLAESLAVNGRLFGLVSSVSTAAVANSTLPSSMCFAVDPDLLQTVEGMTRPYKVRVEGGRTVPGKGTEAARDWLNRLRELTRGQCVISVPYADADLVALSRSGAVDLSQLSLASAAVVHQILAVQPAKELYWPAGGTVDQRTLVDIAAFGPTTVLADPSHLRDVEGKAPYDVTGPQTANAVRALPVDALLSRSLTPSTGSGDLQDGLAALAFRTIFDPRGGDPVIVAPPRRWTASATELGLYLDLAEQLFRDGFATPRSLIQVMSGPDRGSTVGLSYTPQDTAKEIPRSVTTDVLRINRIKRDLLAAMDDDNTTEVDPNELLSPMQYGLLRGVSAAWRGRADQATATVEYVDQQVATLRGRVEVKDPGRPLTLASGDSPIPLNVNNRLPVAIVVRIKLVASAGLRPVQFTDIRIPPLSSRSPLVDAEVIRAGRFTVDASLTTPGGTKLGSTARLEVTSSSYGAITVAITGVAGGVLVLLVILRVFRRVRAARARTKGSDDTGVPVDA